MAYQQAGDRAERYPSPNCQGRDQVKPEEQEQPLWYLGLDVGTTGISAVLVNDRTRCFYPLEWCESDLKGSVTRQKRRWGTELEPLSLDEGIPVALNRLKPYLDEGLPYVEGPGVQWSDDRSLSYRTLIEGMARQLRALLEVRESSRTVRSRLNDASVQPLSNRELQEIVSRLSGVVVGCPYQWSDAYRFNLREAILKAGWVDRGEKIRFVDEAIALVLSELRDTGQGIQWQGATLIIDSGATTTEFALVDIPLQRSQLSYKDFHLGSLSYGGDAIDQDIICQLLLSTDNLFLPPSDGERGEKGILFPEPGTADRQKRDRLARYLRSIKWGPAMFEIAEEIKYRLQFEDRMTVVLDEQKWTVTRRDLELKVFVPFLRGLNREINRLFAQTGTASQGVRQALCTGGSASLGAIARWLRQKLPSAAIIQDRMDRHEAPKCSRVAYGLANLPLNPLFLDRPRHQYSDYFLLLELLRVMPAIPISEKDIFQLLEKQGINTDSCRDRLRRLLQGTLPPGFDRAEAVVEKPWCSQLDGDRYQLNTDYYKDLLIQCDRLLELSAQNLEEPYLILSPNMV
ncbi:hypothetical protein [Roseofilum casamattae]|uniref:Uncharacterized protein n=1 Tax=Roseofilum casamattae BLCC-M143 TaxID=3022442 RepID=A0ABT7BZS7_9CYAN|nr:hypothetical protein [Roseofilum casamattae]MDJ1184712.1 hypothetical protein [Roseofilum casamattae BLCC-M143]